MTLAFWLGFGTCLLLVAFLLVLSAVRMAGLCSQEERAAYDHCPGCGATMIPGLRVEWVTRDLPCDCTARDARTGVKVHDPNCRSNVTLTGEPWLS